MTIGYKPGLVPGPEERPKYANAREKEAADKKAQRQRQVERRILAGLIKHRTRGGIRHPLDCVCYDCLYPEKV